MKMTLDEFRRWPHKAITLLGMSGVGKTTLAARLPKSTWFHYSGDYRIGTRYLGEPILDNIKTQAMQVDFLRVLLRSDSIYIANNITVDNLAPLSTFVGKLGNPELGGLALEEFERRQRLHYDAEVGAMRDLHDFIRKAQEIYGYSQFLNDAGGSVCELRDEQALQTLGEETLVFYIRADEDLEQELIERQLASPKPMYYEQQFLDRHVTEYLHLKGLESAGQIQPDDFVRWVFPRLIEHRRPLYQRLADQHGVTVSAEEAAGVRDEQDFLTLIEARL